MSWLTKLSAAWRGRLAASLPMMCSLAVASATSVGAYARADCGHLLERQMPQLIENARFLEDQ
jgi:hypothetical protein